MSATEPNRRETKNWRGRETPAPSDAECVVSCRVNSSEAANKEQIARKAYASLHDGDDRIPAVLDAIARHESDKRHWENMARWYEERVAATPDGRVIAPSRIPGEDDVDEEAPYSAWADIGGAT